MKKLFLKTLITAFTFAAGKCLPFLIMFIFTVFISFSTAEAQELEETLNNLSEIAGKSYVAPLVTGFGSNLNGGWFHKAPAPKIFGLDLELGVVAMGTFLSDEDKTFSTSGLFRFNMEQASILAADVPEPAKTTVINAIIQQDFTVGISGPTVIGSENENVKIVFDGAMIEGYNVPAQVIELTGVTGIMKDLEILPLAAPQASIGTIFGTQITFRYLPGIEIDEEIGEINYFGFGIQHNPEIWLGIPLPFNIAAGFFTQTLEIGKYIKATTTSFGLNASKKLGPGFLNLTPYAGYMFESSNLEFTYDYNIDTPAGPSTQSIRFDMDGKNKNRMTVGLCLKLGIFNINADYNIGKVNSATAGLMIGF